MTLVIIIIIMIMIMDPLLSSTSMASPSPSPSSSKSKDNEKRLLRANADFADKLIIHIEHAKVADKLSTGTHILFFGAVWCKYTQRFTPKWLEIQNKIDSFGWTKNSSLFSLAKVECSQNEGFCQSAPYKVDGYPTILLFDKGVLIEEYLAADEVEPMLTYISNQYNERVLKSSSPSPLTNNTPQLRHLVKSESAKSIQFAGAAINDAQESKLSKSDIDTTTTNPEPDRNIISALFFIISGCLLILCLWLPRLYQTSKAIKYNQLK